MWTHNVIQHMRTRLHSVIRTVRDLLSLISWIIEDVLLWAEQAAKSAVSLDVAPCEVLSRQQAQVQIELTLVLTDWPNASNHASMALQYGLSACCQGSPSGAA